MTNEELVEPLRELAHELGCIDETLREQNKASTRRIRWAAVSAAVTVVAMLLVGAFMVTGLQSQREFSEKRELSELQHRIRKEECVVKVLNQVVEKRINAWIDEPINLCNTEALLPELCTRYEELSRKVGRGDQCLSEEQHG